MISWLRRLLGQSQQPRPRDRYDEFLDTIVPESGRGWGYYGAAVRDFVGDRRWDPPAREDIHLFIWWGRNGCFAEVDFCPRSVQTPPGPPDWSLPRYTKFYTRRSFYKGMREALQGCELWVAQRDPEFRKLEEIMGRAS